MLRHSTFTLWSVIKEIKFEYSSVLMKTLEVNEKSRRNQGGILPKLLIYKLLITLEYQTGYSSNAKA